MKDLETKHQFEAIEDEAEVQSSHESDLVKSKEVNGPQGPEPTRFGDWERKGRCVDF